MVALVPKFQYCPIEGIVFVVFFCFFSVVLSLFFGSVCLSVIVFSLSLLFSLFHFQPSPNPLSVSHYACRSLSVCLCLCQSLCRSVSVSLSLPPLSPCPRLEDAPVKSFSLNSRFDFVKLKKVQLWYTQIAVGSSHS